MTDFIISYQAVFKKDGDCIEISFPDVPSAFTCAYSENEAKLMAKEVLELVLHKRKVTDLPVSSIVDSIKCDNTAVEVISITMQEENGVLYGNDIIEFDYPLGQSRLHDL